MRDTNRSDRSGSLDGALRQVRFEKLMRVSVDVNVDQLIEGELGRWLADQSGMRRAAKEQAKSRWIWSGGLTACVLVYAWFVSGWGMPIILFLTLTLSIAAGAWGYMPIANASEAIKVGINSAIARSFGLSYTAQVEPGAEFKLARTYGLLPQYTRRHTEDRWFGALEGHDFSLYEAHLEVRRGSGKNKRWETVFQGAVLDVEFGRSFGSTTLLQRAGTHRKWFGLGGSKDHVSFGGHRLDLVDQVHPAFEDAFGVYSDDQVEARVLVHPSYIEHLIALERAFRGDQLRALFHKGSVIIAVESERLFESGSVDESGDRKRVREAAEQFTALAKLAIAINQTERGRSLDTRATG